MATFTFTNGYDDTGAPDTVTGSSFVSDIVRFQIDSLPVTADERIFDMRITDFTSIEELRFTILVSQDIDPVTVQLSASEIGAGLASDLLVKGVGGAIVLNAETIEIYMDNATAVDISGWTFQDWGNQGEQINIFGDADAETITGSSQADYISAAGGNDVLEGGVGVDTIIGGAGDDVIRYVNGQDGDIGEIVDGGTGNDRVQLVLDPGVTDLTFDLQTVDFTSIETVEFILASKQDAILQLSASEIGAGLASNLVIDGQFSVDAAETISIDMGVATILDLSGWTFSNWGEQGDQITVTGDGDAEFITGSSRNDELLGAAGADILIGGAGDDTLEGGVDSDEMYGDAGNDIFRYVDGQDGTIAEKAYGGIGNDRLLLLLGSGATDLTFDLQAVNFSSIEEVQFTSAANMDATMRLSASAIGAGLAADLHVFGTNLTATRETIEIEMGTDTVLDLSGWTFQNWGLQGERTIIFGDADPETITGSSQVDDIVAAGGNDTLDGGAGADQLVGGAGDDVLDGGAGNDLLDGGAGTDTASFAGAVGGIVADLAAGTATGDGADQLIGIENLAGSGFDDSLTGDTGVNTITGGAGDDTIDGGDGDDVLMGGAGGDVLNGGAGNDTIDGGADIDTADYGTAGAGVTVNLSLATAQNTGGAGSDVLSNIENLTGSAFNDALTGDGTANRIDGGLGNDTIFAGAGADTLIGGAGNDVLVGNADIFAQVADTFDGGAGNDTLLVENSDTFDGGDGRDFLYVVNSRPMTVDLAATSIEWVRSASGDDNFDASAQTYTGGVVIYAQGGNDTATGSAFNDFLFGGAGDDTLTGGDGADVLFGDVGADMLIGGAGNDRVFVDVTDISFSGDAGNRDELYVTGATGMTVDLAATGFEWARGSTVGDDVFTATGQTDRVIVFASGGNDSITGSDQNDSLWGEAGNDAISGGLGNDALVGGSGMDVLTGGGGIDNLYFGNADGAVDMAVFDAGWGTDFVYQFEDGTDRFDMSALGITFGDLTITDAGANAHIAHGSDLIVAVGMAGLIDAGDFIF